jgi:lysozyme family protein
VRGLLGAVAWALSRVGRSADGAPAANLPDGNRVVLPHVVLAVEPAARFARCVAEVLNHEGGFVNHPKDPGGATNRGITHITLADWRGGPVTAEDVRTMSEAEAREIYRARYWNAIQGDNLPAGVDLAVFDLAVNSGVGRAARMLQQQLGVTVDGAIGPKTLAAVRRVNAARLAGDLCRARLAWLRGLNTWPVFGKGWEARVVAVERAALAMVR